MPRPGGPRGHVPEKSKDFKGSMKRLFASLKRWHVLLIFSLILAMTSAILALIAPNKLSDLTDTITLGISPKMDEETINGIMSNPDISNDDKMQFKQLLDGMDESNTDNSKLLSELDQLPTSIQDIIRPSIDMNRVRNIAILLTVL